MKIRRIFLMTALAAALAVTSAVPTMAETITSDTSEQAVVTAAAATTKLSSS